MTEGISSAENFLDLLESSSFSIDTLVDNFYGDADMKENFSGSGSQEDFGSTSSVKRVRGRGKYAPNKKTLANVELLESMGFGRDELIRLYVDEKLLTSEIKEIISGIDGVSVHCSTVNILLKFWEIPFRNREEVLEINRKSRAIKTANKHERSDCSKTEIISFYHDLGTFKKVSEKTNLPYGFVRKILSSEGYEYEKNKSYSIGPIMDKFEKIGLEKSAFEKKYVSSTRTETTKWLADVLGMEISFNDFTKILRHLGVRKVVEHKKPKRNNPEANRLYDLERLKKAGFDSVQALADYFESHPKVSYGRLLVKLNSCLSEDDYSFTPHWIERNMIPLLPFDPNRHPASPRDAVAANYCRLSQ